LTKDSNVAVGAGSIVNGYVVGDVADELHDQGCGDSAAEAMPRGVVGLRLILGVYSPLSIAAMPPVSLVGLSWAMDASDSSGARLIATPRACRPLG
jgi:hypothetical protein